MLARRAVRLPFMPPFERHGFVCENSRDPAEPRGCCPAKGSKEIRARLRPLAKDAGLKGTGPIKSPGCLDQCGVVSTLGGRADDRSRRRRGDRAALWPTDR